MPPKYARLAGLGAFGATAGLVALLGALVYATTPRAGGGIDWTNAAVTWVACGVLFAALIAIHVVIGRKLLQLGRGDAAHPL